MESLSANCLTSGPGPGKGDASAGDDDRPAASTQQLGRPLQAGYLRSRANGRISREPGLEEQVQIGLPLDGLPDIPPDLQVNRSRTSGGGLPKGLAEEVGQALGQVDLGVELAQRLKQRKIIHFLVDAAVLALGKPAAGDGNDGRTGQKGVAQPCRQVGRTDGLGHAHPGPARDSSVAVGHVDGRLLAVSRDPHDIPAFHFRQCRCQDGGDQKDMGDFIGLHGLGEVAGSGHGWHGYPSGRA